MTTAVIGATGRVGSEVVRGILGRGDAVAALVRDPDKARRAFGRRARSVAEFLHEHRAEFVRLPRADQGGHGRDACTGERS